MNCSKPEPGRPADQVIKAVSILEPWEVAVGRKELPTCS
jgi:hypothetical protein